MTEPVPHIFDRALRQKRLRRAAPSIAQADFLLRRIASDMNERLLDVTRTFNHALIIAPLPALQNDMPALKTKAKNIKCVSVIDDNFDEENPNLPAAHYELIISIGGLHVVNDLTGSLIQYHRALKPDGLFLAGFAGGDTLTELRHALLQAESELENGMAAHIHPFGELRALGGLLQRAGFALPVADSDSFTVRYPTPFALLKDLRQMGETNILAERRRTPLRRATLMRAMDIYTEQFADTDGKIRASFELLYLSGWAPHESQQKPLPRGSAKMRLADALGTKEQKLKN